MNRKVKYYRALNWAYYVAARMKTKLSLSEMQCKLDGIVSVIFYDFELTPEEARMIQRYSVKVLRNYARRYLRLPRQSVATSGATPEGGIRYNSTNCPINRTLAHCTIEYRKCCAFCTLHSLLGFVIIKVQGEGTDTATQVWVKKRVHKSP